MDEKFTNLVWSKIHTPKQFEAKARRRFFSRIDGQRQGGTLDEKLTNLVWSQIHTPKQFEAKVRRRFFHIDGKRALEKGKGHT